MASKAGSFLPRADVLVPLKAALSVYCIEFGTKNSDNTLGGFRNGNPRFMRQFGLCPLLWEAGWQPDTKMTFKFNCRGTLHRVLAVGLMVAGLSFADSFITTVSPAGVQTPDIGSLCASTPNCVIGMEDFNSWTGGGFTTDFGTNNEITGTYAGSFVSLDANGYGGAGGVGRYPVVSGTAGGAAQSYSLTLSTSGVPGVNYFGLWISALDAPNTLQFYNGDTLAYTFTGADLMSLIGACLPGPNPYCGNPNFQGYDPGEQFAFVNFFDTNGYITKIVLSEVGGGFESDNHTVAYLVPEPGSLGLFVAGGVVFALRVRRRPLVKRF